MVRKPSEDTISAWARLVRARDRIVGAVERDLKAAGLPPLSWYDALLELNRVGPEGLRPFELERELLLAQHNVSRLLDRLDAAGFVARAPCAEDGRGQLAILTTEGRAMLKRMWPVYAAALQREMGAKLNEAEMRALAQLLAKIGQL